jgi:hypothetical protein
MPWLKNLLGEPDPSPEEMAKEKMVGKYAGPLLIYGSLLGQELHKLMGEVSAGRAPALDQAEPLLEASNRLMLGVGMLPKTRRTMSLLRHSARFAHAFSSMAAAFRQEARTGERFGERAILDYARYVSDDLPAACREYDARAAQLGWPTRSALFDDLKATMDRAHALMDECEAMARAAMAEVESTG